MINKTPIDCFSLKQGHDSIREELKLAINRVIDSDWYILGKELRQFEEEFSDFCGTKFAAGVASGLDAIKIALLAGGVRPGDTVVVPAHTFIGTALAASEIGAKLSLVDVEPDTGLLSKKSIDQIELDSVRAIVPVHLYGNVCEMDSIVATCKNHNVLVVEDAAQAHGSSLNSRAAGSLGDVGAFSLYPTKNVGALGDGGIITTSNPDIFEQIEKLRNYGSKQKYEHEVLGTNSRLSEIQAAALLIKLKKFIDCDQQRRIERHQFYEQQLANIPELTIVSKSGANQTPIHHLLVVKTSERDKLKNYLLSVGIGTQIHYAKPLHLHQAYAHLEKGRGSFPNAEEFCANCLSLPFYPELQKTQIETICKHISLFFGCK